MGVDGCGGGMKAGRDMWTKKGGSSLSFGGLEGEGELGPGLALAEDDFLFLLLLLLTVLLQLHALLVNLSLLLHNTQLILGQLGLSFGDLAVILLQDFFQLLPLRFFFLLSGLLRRQLGLPLPLKLLQQLPLHDALRLLDAPQHLPLDLVLTLL